MKLLVCGGRDYTDKDALYRYLDSFAQAQRDFSDPVELLIHGDARGVDKLAHLWAVAHGVHPVSVPAQWAHFGSRAGPVRNLLMLSLLPDVVIAFPGGAGTAHMVRVAKRATVRVIEPFAALA